MDTLAVVFEAPERLGLQRLALAPEAGDDLLVAVEWSGISTGTERLLYTGRMPPFPGLGYPLVPGYETVGRVVEAAPGARHAVGTRVFVPGARCFGPVRGLFGGAADRIAVASDRVVAIDEPPPGAAEAEAEDGARAVLLALAATARHAVAAEGARLPDLVVGHGVLGRLLARITLACGGPAPTVWESNPDRRAGATGYAVIDPATDSRRDYRAIYDVSGDAGLLDALVQRLAPGGEIVLAGFYAAPLSLSFPPAFMREARLRVAAEWRPADLVATQALVRAGSLRLDGLVTHRCPASDAAAAYRTAFEDPSCLKMILDWRGCR